MADKNMNSYWLILVAVLSTRSLVFSIEEDLTWEGLLNITRASKNITKVQETNDDASFEQLFDDVTDVERDETELQDQPFIIRGGGVDDFDEGTAWDRLINSRHDDKGKQLETLSLVKEEDQLVQDEEVKGASLAFVFDSTGSMTDELKQVKIGASKIMNAMLERKDRPIYNYILVPFKDPGIGPVTVTSDHALFKQRLDEIVVYGGGDCPEMSVTAIIKALEVALPNSYIYVFTDAYAKDFSRVNEALSLIQKKQSQVEIVMTDECTESNMAGLQVFEKIATMSSGQVYRLNKSEVIEVLKYVKVSLQPQKVTLLSENKPAPPVDKPDEHQLVVDESLKEFTVSVSGKNATIGVTDPKGKKVEGPPQLEPLLTLTNVKVVNVKEPDPGPWKVTIGSDSDYTLRSTGLSGVDFVHGFSITDTNTMDETSHRPLKGAPNFILIQPTNLDQVQNITRVDVVGIDGSMLKQVGLEPSTISGVFKGRGFEPPTDLFYLGIHGYDKHGAQIKRVSSTAVTSQLPEKPAILMRHTVTVFINQPVTLRCHVESLVPFTLQWFKDGYILSEPQWYQQTCDAVWELNKADEFSEGYYSCRAANVAGTTNQKVYLNVTDHPPRVEVPNHMIVPAGRSINLTCLVHSKLKYNMQWYRLLQDSLQPVHQQHQHKQNTLTLNSVSESDDGWYVCSATNKGGKNEGRIHLTVGQPLKIKLLPENLNFKTGDSVVLNCTAEGKPKPNLVWKKDGAVLMNYGPAYFIQETNNASTLNIEFADKHDSGTYECLADNNIEIVSSFSVLTYTEAPTVTAVKNNLMVRVEQEAILSCEVTGIPEPEVRWYTGGVEIEKDGRFEVSGSTLIIRNVLISDAGEFSCSAENIAGRESAYIGLFVGTSPKFIHRPRDKKVEISRSSILPCSAVSNPAARVTWERSDGQQLDGSRMLVTASGSLRVTQAEPEDEGGYICRAENIFGNISADIKVYITGIVKPAIDNTMVPSTLKTVSGDTITVPCRVMKGNPPPTITWYKNGEKLNMADDKTKYNQDSENNLVINKLSTSDRGKYECRVTNVAGTVSLTYDVSVSEPPIITNQNQSEFRVKNGEEVRIPCPVEADPKPTVSWIKDGEQLPESDLIYQEDDGTLVIKKLTIENSGVYVCVALNEAGSASKANSIQVLVPPEIKHSTTDGEVNIVEGHVVTLNCKTFALPPASIEWFKNEEKHLTNDETTPEVLRFIATVGDTGIYKCVATNEAGSVEKHFNLTILVPPKANKAAGEEETITATAGKAITLHCNVDGFPTPFIIWQRRGMYIVENTTDLTITNDGLLILLNVTKDSAGAYICDAENIAGITQKIFYLHVNFPPSIVEEIDPELPITLISGETFSIPCLVEGFPKPQVVWRRNGQPLYTLQGEMKILEDNTLVLLMVRRETTGNYTCQASNQEGSVETNYKVEVLIPPSLATDAHYTKYEVNEGETLILTCPTIDVHPPPTIQWIKNGVSLMPLLRERSDEAQMKLSEDQRSLRIPEAHPDDSGNYSCIATNIAGRTDASFQVEILLTPHFEEFNHVAHRTVLAGGEVILNCSVSGNPLPKVSWKKESAQVSANNTPGVVTSLDKQHLIIPRGKVYHSGTYTCTATNKVNSKEREFYVNVIEPPKIYGPKQESEEVLAGGNVTFECPVSGIPKPVIKWERIQVGKQRSANKTQTSDDGTKLTIVNADCDDDGVYLCEATNPAGTKIKYFNLTVLEPPAVDETDAIENLHVPMGGNITLRCKFRGRPKPSVAWIHNGHVISQNHVTRRRRRYVPDPEDDVIDVSLDLVNVDLDNSGSYTALASNRAGVVEKNFQLTVVAPPRLAEYKESEKSVTVLKNLSVILDCPVQTDVTTTFQWLYNNQTTEEDGNMHGIDKQQLAIKSARPQHSGHYSCIAYNQAGSVTSHFQLLVLDPPFIEERKRIDLYRLTANDTLILNCNGSGHPEPNFLWLHLSTPIKNVSDYVTVTNGGKTLQINGVSLRHAGRYTCIASNVAGAAEKHFDVDIQEPPMVKDATISHVARKKVKLHRRLTLSCPFSGTPSPTITWSKNGQPLTKSEDTYISVTGLYLTILQATPHHVGNYTCNAVNDVGNRELTFSVDVIVSAEWTPWSDWSGCSTTCGPGHQSRTRICTFGQDLNPNLIIDKSECEKEDIQRRVCYSKECPVNGGWSIWNPWTSCSQTCDSGFRKRYRKCDSPQPEHGGHDCVGSDTEQEDCQLSLCPVDGAWSEWTPWSSCNNPCDEKTRTRKCDSPHPENNGLHCDGADRQAATCDQQKCLNSGVWSEWNEWSTCSATCGTGHRKRVRKCRATKLGKKCVGDNLQIGKCFTTPCADMVLPLSANIHVKGELNGDRIDNNVVADIANEERQTVISTVTSDLLKRQAGWFPYTPFLLTPVSWNTAYEADNAENGISLTKGRFFSESNIEFATGEGVRFKHEGKGIDSEGTLQVEIEVAGELPVLEPQAAVKIKPLQQNYVQTGPNTLYSELQNDLDVEGTSLSYTWNSSIQYDMALGTMPYPAERLTSSDIEASYDQSANNVTYKAAAKIEPVFDIDESCPVGFIHDIQHNLCQDYDECSSPDEDTACHRTQVCQNTFGSYKCTCDIGYRSGGVGEPCLDIDECLIQPTVCSHSCTNIDGSFECACPVGYTLGDDHKTCVVQELFEEDYDSNLQDVASLRYLDNSSNCEPGFMLRNKRCKDIDECEGYHECDEEEICLNTVGSYECLEASCPEGFTRSLDDESLSCVKFCDDVDSCESSEMIAEVISYQTVSVKRKKFKPLHDLIQLDVVGSSSTEKTRFSVQEPQQGYRVRVVSGRGALYSLHKIKANVIHKVVVQALTFNSQEKLLYKTKFIIFLYINKFSSSKNAG